MADKQLTVAELLARAENGNSDSHRRPRRRRSLEDGGVSVAELTDSFKKVDVKPAEVKHSSVPIDAPSDTPAPAEAAAPKEKPAKEPADKEPAPFPKAQPSNEETTVLRKVAAEPTTKPAPAQSDDTNEIRAVQAPEPQPKVEVGRVERVERGNRTEPAEAQSDELEPAESTEVEDASVNPILLVLLVFAGVVLGVLGFLAFSWLWANTAAIVAALLGVAAVAAVVAAVGAMATGRDKLTMVFAGLAAAVMAFGPALL